MLCLRLLDFTLNPDKIGMSRRQVNLCFRLSGADITRDVQVEIVLSDLVQCHTPGVTLLLRAIPVGGDNSLDVFVAKLVLPLALCEVLGGVDEQRKLPYSPDNLEVELSSMLRPGFEPPTSSSSMENPRRLAKHGVSG